MNITLIKMKVHEFYHHKNTKPHLSILEKWGFGVHCMAPSLKVSSWINPSFPLPYANQYRVLGDVPQQLA